MLIDEVERSPYDKLTEDTKGPLNQINIRTEGDHLVDLSKRSNVSRDLRRIRRSASITQMMTMKR